MPYSNSSANCETDDALRYPFEPQSMGLMASHTNRPSSNALSKPVVSQPNPSKGFSRDRSKAAFRLRKSSISSIRWAENKILYQTRQRCLTAPAQIFQGYLSTSLAPPFD